MKFLLGKRKRIIYARKIKEFWEDFRRNRVGLVGIAFVIIFVLIAAFARWIAPYDPIYDKGLAAEMAMPEWFTAFPQYMDLPQTMYFSVNWSVGEGSILEYVNFEWNWTDEELKIRYAGATEADIYLYENFSYPYIPPPRFDCDFKWGAEKVNETAYSIEIILVSPGGRNYSLWDSYYGYPLLKPKQTDEIPLLTTERKSAVQLNSGVSSLIRRLGFDPNNPINLTKLIFSEKGEYRLFMHVRFMPNSENATCEIFLKDTEFKILGLVHGILGADYFGADIFSQLIYGSQISLMIGLLSAILTTVIGIIVGVAAGYIGGAVDELLMRTVDVFLCLPFLQILIVLVFFFGRNIFYVVLLLAVFGWQGLARVIRSQVLSLREMPFVEAAKAAGGSRSYIMLRHIVPNIFPVAFAAMVLTVPTAIITEAALSFIGMGDPRLPSWGRMLNLAFRWGGFTRLAWWWIIPPGLAITLLSMSFVFVGHALDEVLNPRLRRRR